MPSINPKQFGNGAPSTVIALSKFCIFGGLKNTMNIVNIIGHLVSNHAEHYHGFRKSDDHISISTWM